MKKPTIWLAPTLASAVLGPVSTQVLKMTNIPSGAGMGTSGLVGQFGAFSAMEGTVETWVLWVEVIIMHFVLPALFTLAFDAIFRKLGWVKKGDMKLVELPNFADLSMDSKDQYGRDMDQWPLWRTENADAVIEAIDPHKDADGLTSINLGHLFVGRPNLVPCTPILSINGSAQ